MIKNSVIERITSIVMQMQKSFEEIVVHRSGDTVFVFSVQN